MLAAGADIRESVDPHASRCRPGLELRPGDRTGGRTAGGGATSPTTRAFAVSAPGDVEKLGALVPPIQTILSLQIRRLVELIPS